MVVGPQHAADAGVGDDLQVGGVHLVAQLGEHRVRIGADALGTDVQTGGQGVDAQCRVGVHVDVPLGHPLGPPRPHAVGPDLGGHADQGRDPGHPLGQEGGAGQRVRGAAGAADHGELADAQLVCDRLDVVRRRGDGPPDNAFGVAVAGSVVGDQTDPQLVEHAGAGHHAEAAAGGAVEQEDRGAVAFSPLADGEQQPVLLLVLDQVGRHGTAPGLRSYRASPLLCAGGSRHSRSCRIPRHQPRTSRPASCGMCFRRMSASILADSVDLGPADTNLPLRLSHVRVIGGASVSFGSVLARSRLPRAGCHRGTGAAWF